MTGIILNRKLKVIPKGMDNLNELKAYTKKPIFQTYNKQINTNDKVFRKLLNLLVLIPFTLKYKNIRIINPIIDKLEINIFLRI